MRVEFKLILMKVNRREFENILNGSAIFEDIFQKYRGIL